MTSRLLPPSTDDRTLPEHTFLSEGLSGWLTSGALISDPESKVIYVGWGPLTRASSPRGTSPTPGFFFVPDFFLDDAEPFWCFSNYSQIAVSTLLSALKAGDPEIRAGQPLDWQEAPRSDFENAFEELSCRFQEKKLTKAVPIITDRASWPSGHRPEDRRIHWLSRSLEYALKAPVHLYGAWSQAEGILGATPELLIRLREDTESPFSTGFTAALAGTRRDLDRASLPPLLDDPKERREHQIVIDGIRLALEPFGKVILHETQEMRLPGLSHLRTPVQLESSTAPSLEQLVRALHPTPALGAFPREAGEEVLRLLDQRSSHRRKRFGAPFGFVHPRLTPCSWAVVAIRGLQWDAKDITLSAGCGVISESVLEKEWMELRAKISSVRRIFGL